MTHTIFSREHFVEAWEEMLPLLEAHYHEVAWRQSQIPLRVDYERYKLLDEEGKLLCFFVRSPRRMVGYSVYFIDHHIHYQTTKYAANDVVFLDPSLRSKGIAADFLGYCERELKALGVDVVTLHVKPQLDFGPLCERIGYELGDRVWLKWLGGSSEN